MDITGEKQGEEQDIDVQAATEGGYGASNAATWVQVGAGEEMVDHAVVRLDKMLGRLHDAPSANWK